jgi:hypothetical protein
MSVSDSPGIRLEPLRAQLRIYCRALAERGIELRDVAQLIEKNIGWQRADVATTDGAAIFLPALVERFGEAGANYQLLKVMLTQQAGHLEFGSFDFDFNRPSTLFQDWRPFLTARGHGHHHHHSTEPAVGGLARLFQCFPNRRLARDIFAAFESARIEARVMRGYPGIAEAYRTLRRDTLKSRQPIALLPAREALLEHLIRVSLGDSAPMAVPLEHARVAIELGALARMLVSDSATVEDAAEASLRAYRLLAPVANLCLEQEHFTLLAQGENDAHRFDAANDRPAAPFALPVMAGREADYLSPPGVEYRGEFQPELAQLLSGPPRNAREQRKPLSAEALAELLRSRRQPTRKGADEQGEEQDSETSQMVQNLMRELERRDPRMQSVDKKPAAQPDDDTGALTANQPDTYVYDEWDHDAARYRARWCRVHEKTMPPGDLMFYRNTLLHYAGLLQRIRREFEQVAPEIYQKEKRLPDGADHDFDAAIEALIDLRRGSSPSEKIFWRHRKTERDVAVTFLLDMSGSTGEVIATAAARSERTQRRIIDVEKEAIVLMADALGAIGDRYAVYGFSGHGRENVEFYVIKAFEEEFSPEIARRLGRAGPLHATRMGPAIRHATSKLRAQQTRARFLFLISDGRPQDRGYSQESSEKSYAVQDTRKALIEARRQGITPFCLTVDKEGNDYLRAMMDDFSYEVLPDVRLLPLRLPQLYRKLTF